MKETKFKMNNIIGQ